MQTTSEISSKRYDFTGKTKAYSGHQLCQIRALVAIDAIGVSVGDVGGWIEAETCLSHLGNAWVSGDAQVSGDAWVYGDARVYGKAEVIWFSHVGSEMGTLIIFRTKDGAIVSRGRFSGTLEEFESAVKSRHGDSQFGREYAALIEMIKIRVAVWRPAYEVADEVQS